MEKTNETLIKDIQKINKIQRQEVLEKEKVAVNAIAEAKNEKVSVYKSIQPIRCCIS